ncbi:MAG TPA: GAF domain-containing protein [Candidatus Limnocylindrales bacterium]
MRRPLPDWLRPSGARGTRSRGPSTSRHPPSTSNPTAPGGPALRSHLPLIVTRGGTDEVLGVLALAHDRPTDPEMRQVLEAAADLAAVAIARGGS